MARGGCDPLRVMNTKQRCRRCDARHQFETFCVFL